LFILKSSFISRQVCRIIETRSIVDTFADGTPSRNKKCKYFNSYLHFFRVISSRQVVTPRVMNEKLGINLIDPKDHKVLMPWFW